MKKYYIASALNADHDLVVGVTDNRAKAGAHLNLSPRSGDFPDGQLWKLVSGPSLFPRHFYIQSALTEDLVIDVTGGSRQPGTLLNVSTLQPTAFAKQLWQMVANDQDAFSQAFYLDSYLGGRVMTVKHQPTEPGTPINIWGQVNPASARQLWTLVAHQERRGVAADDVREITDVAYAVLDGVPGFQVLGRGYIPGHQLEISYDIIADGLFRTVLEGDAKWDVTVDFLGQFSQWAPDSRIAPDHVGTGRLEILITPRAGDFLPQVVVATFESGGIFDVRQSRRT